MAVKGVNPKSHLVKKELVSSYDVTVGWFYACYWAGFACLDLQ